MTLGSGASDLKRHVRVGACLSLSGRYARFGAQAARALEAWRSLDGNADLVVQDDHSDPRTLETTIEGVASGVDVLLGPYSTQLMRVAGRIAADSGWLLWNHGGSGDDVEEAHPGHVISVLTPTSRYAEPFVRRLGHDTPGSKLWIVQGRGSFGRQVSVGAEEAAARLGIETERVSPDGLPPPGLAGRWDLFSAGTFEDDVTTVRQVLRRPDPPRMLCTVAAGVGEFADVVGDVTGVFAVGQWFQGRADGPELGPSESAFLEAYRQRGGTRVPDYPAVQAVAAAVVATHCARRASGVTRDLLWPMATDLDTSTLFGGFKVDPRTGVQLKHEAVLARWTLQGLVAVG